MKATECKRGWTEESLYDMRWSHSVEFELQAGDAEGDVHAVLNVIRAQSSGGTVREEVFRKIGHVLATPFWLHFH